jgi:hypothetical protein
MTQHSILLANLRLAPIPGGLAGVLLPEMFAAKLQETP